MANTFFIRLGVFGLLIAGLVQSLSAAITVDTQSLHLQFSEQGDLLRVESCFPTCSEEGAKTRVLSSQNGMFVFERDAKSQFQICSVTTT